jgi:microcystin degradation protein MlrC
MKSRVAIAGLIQESNTFSPVLTRYSGLSPVYGPGVLARHQGKLTEVGGFLDVLQAEPVEIVPVSAAWAVTAGRVVRKDLERLLARMLRELRSAGKLDGILVALHGAQTAEGIDDVEGYVLRQLRELVGIRIPIIVTLDLHANVTRAMVDAAAAILGYRTFPHIDMFETGRDAATLMLRTLRGEVRPSMAWRKLPLILNAETSQTTSGPMRATRRAADGYVKKGMLAVSLFPVQPWLDIEEMGTAVVAVSDGDPAAAEACVRTLAKRLWRDRHLYHAKLTPVEEAITEALRIEGGPVVFGESADSTGSGSPGDSTGILKQLLTAPLPGPAAIFLVDPLAVERAFQAGIGKTIRSKMGGYYDREHSKPVSVKGYVRMLSDGRWTPRARGYNTGIDVCMGRAAVIEAGQVKILLAERSAMTVDPELFRSHGIEPLHCKIVCVKSPNGFRAAYEPIAKAVFMVDTPGISTAKLDTLPWKRLARPIYPLDLDMPDPVL